MEEELQKTASEEQTPVTPDAETVQPEPAPTMVPESDLRALQAVKDREVAAAKREAEGLRQQMQALQASMEGQMDALAQRTMEPEDYSAYSGVQQQQRQADELQRQQYEAQKLKTIVDLAGRYNIPVNAFDAVRANPYAAYGEAFQVVSDHQEKQLKELEQRIATQQREAETATRQTQRQERQTTGADSIGSPAEPATGGSPDLMAQYQKERQAILTGVRSGSTRKNWTTEMLNLKDRYRKLGLDI